MFMQWPSTPMLLRSALAICSRSIRTPVRLTVCVATVPSATVGMRFKYRM